MESVHDFLIRITTNEKEINVAVWRSKEIEIEFTGKNLDTLLEEARKYIYRIETEETEDFRKYKMNYRRR